jgi:molybdopterin-guanine dinucleotide biosynthesis protein A
MSLGVIILTGGRSSRMGVDKAELLWDGRRAVDRLVDVAAKSGATRTLTVGGRGYGLPWIADATPGGGPMSGVMTGLAALEAAGCCRALVLAVDAPTLTVADLEPLLRAPGPGAAYEDLNLPLVIAAGAAARDAGPGWPVRRFVEASGLRRIAPPPGAAVRLRGANTPAERQALLAALTGAGSAEKPGAG